MAHVGVEPLTIVPLTNGTTAYVYARDIAPEGIVPERLTELVDQGFLVEVAVADYKPAKPARSSK